MTCHEESSRMAQLVDFAVEQEKLRYWHLSFLRELLLLVFQEKPTERAYWKWLRGRKVFDRRFVAFCERFVGFERKPGSAPALTEIGRELVSAHERGKKKLDDEVA